jgi:hypothetical protein
MFGGEAPKIAGIMLATVYPNGKKAAIGMAAR